jgi:hypothetical protein
MRAPLLASRGPAAPITGLPSLRTDYVTTDGAVAGCQSFPGSRRPATVSSPILSIVRPCFGQNSVKCWGVDDLVQIRPPLSVILDGKGNANEFHDGPESN